MFGKGDVKRKFLRYAKEFSLSSNNDDNARLTFDRVMMLVQRLIKDNQWESLSAIEVMYESGLVTQGDLRLFFMCIYKFAKFRLTRNKNTF